MCENKERPDLELERLVMGDEADGVRPSEGWLVREDVVRGAVERIKSARDRAKRHAEDMQLAIARQNAARADADKLIAELRAQVEALTAQLGEEERMVARFREVVLGAPRRWVNTDVDCGRGYYVAEVRLSPDGLELAATTEDTDNTEGADS